eukprot:7376804-Prymnesium_polylepis.1
MGAGHAGGACDWPRNNCFGHAGRVHRSWPVPRRGGGTPLLIRSTAVTACASTSASALASTITGGGHGVKDHNRSFFKCEMGSAWSFFAKRKIYFGNGRHSSKALAETFPTVP